MLKDGLLIIMIGVLFGVGANLVDFITDIVNKIIDHRHQRMMMKKITVFALALKDAKVCKHAPKSELKRNSKKK